MTDNELFNHFKTQSIALEEIPSDELWSKIEAGLDNTKPTGKSNVLLFIVCGILLTASIAWYFATPDSIDTIALPIQTGTTIAPGPENSNTDAHEEKITLPNPNAGKTTSVKNHISVQNPVDIVAVKQDSVKKITVRTAKITVATEQKSVSDPSVKFISYKKGTVAPLEKSLTFEVQKKETFGNIIIITKQKITTEEYNRLIADMLDTYESKPGALLTIKAPGHVPFKKVMGLDHKLTVGLKLDDSIFNPKRVKSASDVLQTEGPKLNITTINPSVITFKNSILKDSLPATKNKIPD